MYSHLGVNDLQTIMLAQRSRLMPWLDRSFLRVCGAVKPILLSILLPPVSVIIWLDSYISALLFFSVCQNALRNNLVLVVSSMGSHVMVREKHMEGGLKREYLLCLTCCFGINM